MVKQKSNNYEAWMTPRYGLYQALNNYSLRWLNTETFDGK